MEPSAGGGGTWNFPEGMESRSSGGDHNQTTKEEGHPEYVAYVLLPVFFLTGLTGVLICHLLKKKGYRCTTDSEFECEEKIAEEQMDYHDGNTDTVGQMVHCIMKNPANAEALQAMMTNHHPGDPESPSSPNGPPSPTSPISIESPSSPTSPTFQQGSQSKHSCHGHHLHTVGGVVEKNACSRCSHQKRRMSRKNSARESRKSRMGEVTVLAVGRFRVTHVDRKSSLKEHKGLILTPIDSANEGENSDNQVPSSPTKLDDKEEKTLQ
ncbi:RELT-like protein 1 isoform X2 [Callorhinchus milii]|uniref:RELT-like protein 1 isoform X2 n=1 Tax=Callorhinchus milii TaxID=7868 RepID=UPI00045728F2|nr:RELT-like protein 1 isoform X2 [Callorhinchus milii]|eukprot:gi/632944041/ref/XP_007887282.1/ PREDICTED: RELT-like protein 1 isoform X2 [Callorhinchus milii]